MNVEDLTTIELRKELEIVERSLRFLPALPHTRNRLDYYHNLKEELTNELQKRSKS